MAIERKRQREGEIERGGKKREKKRERGERVDRIKLRKVVSIWHN